MSASKPRRYAEDTEVPVARSKLEIDALLRTHGAKAIATIWDSDRYALMFEMRGRRVRLDLRAPDPKEFSSTRAFEKEERRRWRVMLVTLKMKLEVVASGDTDFDAEFLAYLVLPDGRTSIGARMIGDLDRALEGRPMPPLLGGG